MLQNSTDQFEIILEKNYPVHARRNIEIPEVSIYSMFKESVRKYNDRDLIIFQNNKLTYAELNDNVEKLSSGLHEMGLKKGDMIGVILPNMPEYVYLLFACTKLGIIPVNINPLYTFNEIKTVVQNTRLRTIFSYIHFLPKIVDLFPIAIDRIVIINDSNSSRNPFNSIPIIRNLIERGQVPEDRNILSFENLGEGLSPVPEEKIDSINDRAFIQYTGGTTGRPRAALISHYNLISNLYIMDEWGKNISRTDTVFISVVPFFHVYGLTTSVLLPIFLGAKIHIIMNPMDSESIIRIIEKNNNILYPSIPALINSLNAAASGRKITPAGSLLVMSGASSLQNSTREAFMRIFGTEIYEAYGLTEASPSVTLSPMDEKMIRYGSVGMPLPNTSVRIVDLKTRNKDVPIGEKGEIIVRGPQIIQEYLNEGIVEPVLKNGWLYTGDIGKMDSEGYLYIIERRKDMIVVSGYNVYSSEVEKVIMASKKVDECAVVGSPDENTGEKVIAFVVVKNDKILTQEELQEFCRRYLADYKVPSVFYFVKYLPKNPLGKILKKELRLLVN